MRPLVSSTETREWPYGQSAPSSRTEGSVLLRYVPYNTPLPKEPTDIQSWDPLADSGDGESNG